MIYDTSREDAVENESKFRSVKPGMVSTQLYVLCTQPLMELELGKHDLY